MANPFIRALSPFLRCASCPLVKPVVKKSCSDWQRRRAVLRSSHTHSVISSYLSYSLYDSPCTSFQRSNARPLLVPKILPILVDQENEENSIAMSSTSSSSACAATNKEQSWMRVPDALTRRNAPQGIKPYHFRENGDNSHSKAAGESITTKAPGGSLSCGR